MGYVELSPTQAMIFGRTFRAFQHRDYFIFWWGLLFGHTGTLVQVTAQGWLVLQLTDSPFYLGLDGLCLGVPRVLFSPLGGALADRMNRRSLFILTQVAFLLTGLFLGLMTAFGLVRVWHILIVSSLTGFFLSFEQPIRQSILHHLVPEKELLNAISLYHLVFHGSVLFGPALGGALIPVVGTAGCFFLRALGGVAVLVTIFMIHIPNAEPPKQKKSLGKDVAEGLSIAWNSPVFFSIFLALTVMSLCTKSYTQFMPIFARDILLVGAPGLGLLLMAPGAGAIVGGLVLASTSRFPRADRLLVTLAGSFGLALVLFSASRSFPLSWLLLFVAGAFQMTFLSSITTLLQLYSTEATRGRIMSLYGLINRGLGPAGAFPIGALATWIGAPLTLSLSALLGAGFTAFVTLRRPYLRESAPLGEGRAAVKEMGV